MPNNTIGEAYLQIKPSMDGISKDIQSAMGDAGSKGSISFGSAFSSGLKKLGTVALSATAAATTAVGAFGTQAIKAFANFEQLEGGVQKLYGKAADEIMKYANQAYKTSGMSANDYMETATSFSASLINSLGGDMSKAAEMTDVAMRAMSDNVNTFGSDFESVQNAFKGFSKANFTMLDNLKLGYGGTKEEMERLLRDAEKYGKLATGSLKVKNFSDIITAVQLVQEKLNVAGTTAKEAMTTIEGSATATKAAWQNVITALGRGEGLDDALNGFFDSMFGKEEGNGLLNQLLPRIRTSIESIGKFIEKASPVIAEKVPAILKAVVPPLLRSASVLISKLGQEAMKRLPQLVKTGMNLLLKVADGIVTNLPTVLKKFSGIVQQIVKILADPNAVRQLTQAAISLLLSFGKSLADNIDVLFDAAWTIVTELGKAIIDNLPELWNVASKIVRNLVNAIEEKMPAAIPLFEQLMAIFETLGNVIISVVGWITNFIEWLNSGSTAAEVLKNVIGGLVITIGAAILAYKTYATVMAIIKAATTAWTAAQTLLNAVLTANPIGMVIAAIAALAALIIYCWNNVEGFADYISSIPGAVAELARTIWDGIKSFFGAIPEFFRGVYETITGFFKGIIDKALNWGSDLIKNFKEGILKKWEDLKAGIKGIAEGIKSFLGFSEPEEGPLSNFHTYAPDMMRLFAQGIKDNESLVYDQIADTFDFGGKLGDFGIVADGTQNLNLGGTIRLEGVNNQGEFIAASEYAIEEIITNILKREARMA